VAPPRTRTCMAIMMTPGIPVPAKIKEVDGVGQGSRNFAARWRVAVVISRTCTTLRDATRERERRVEVVGGGQVEEGLVELVCSPPSLGPPLYRGEGCTLTPLPRQPRAAAKGRDRATAARVGPGRPASKTLTLAG
jgi:hypothetical protein